MGFVQASKPVGVIGLCSHLSSNYSGQKYRVPAAMVADAVESDAEVYEKIERTIVPRHRKGIQSYGNVLVIFRQGV